MGLGWSERFYFPNRFPFSVSVASLEITRVQCRKRKFKGWSKRSFLDSNIPEKRKIKWVFWNPGAVFKAEKDALKKGK